MDFPSKEASHAARPLLRPRGVRAADFGRRALRQMAHLLQSRPWDRPGGGEDGYTSNPRSSNPRDWTAGVAAVRAPMREPMMRRPPSGGFAVEEVGGDSTHTLILTGELDARSVPALEAAIGRYCADGPPAMTLDLSELSFIDSSGLWTILAAMRWCERQGRGFSLLPGPESVQQVFEITGLVDVLPFRSAPAR
jgi:anti-anti-sigma factor